MFMNTKPLRNEKLRELFGIISEEEGAQMLKDLEEIRAKNINLLKKCVE